MSNQDSDRLSWEQLDTQLLGEAMVNTIRNLESENKEVRENALHDLFDICWDRGNSYWKTAFAIPFLIQRIQQEPDEYLLDLTVWNIAHFASGDSSFIEKVNQGINLYLDLLESESVDLRISTVYLLSFCQKDPARIRNRLCDHFHTEPEEMVRATIPLCLVFLSKIIPVDTSFFEEILKSNAEDAVKFCAVTALAYIAGKNMTDEAMELLVSLWDDSNLLDRLAAYYDYDCPMVTTHCLRLLDYLKNLSDRHLAKIVPIIWQEKNRYYKIEDAYDLFLKYRPFEQKKFPEGITIDDLTESQQVLVRLVTDDTDDYRSRNCGNSILRLLGLHPGSPSGKWSAPEKLIGFVNGEPLEYDK